MTLLTLLGFVYILEYHIRKINVAFLVKQNIFLVYVIMSFGSVYLFKSYA